MQTASSLTAKRKAAKLQKQAERLVKRTKRETHASFKTDRNRDNKVLNGRKMYCKKMTPCTPTCRRCGCDWAICPT